MADTEEVKLAFLMASNRAVVTPYWLLEVAFTGDMQGDTRVQDHAELWLPFHLWTFIPKAHLTGAEFSWHIGSLYWSTETLRSCSADRLTENRGRDTGLPPSEINPTNPTIRIHIVYTHTLPAAVEHVHFHAVQLKTQRRWHIHTC